MVDSVISATSHLEKWWNNSLAFLRGSVKEEKCFIKHVFQTLQEVLMHSVLSTSDRGTFVCELTFIDYTSLIKSRFKWGVFQHTLYNE